MHNERLIIVITIIMQWLKKFVVDKLEYQGRHIFMKEMWMLVMRRK